MTRALLGKICKLCEENSAEQYHASENNLCLECFLENSYHQPKFLRKYFGTVCSVCGGSINAFQCGFYGLRVIKKQKYYFHDRCVTSAGFGFNI